MSIHNEEDCPLCGGTGEVDITPYGEPDSETESYGCPICIQAQRDAAEQRCEELLHACKEAKKWLEGWASAEPYLSILEQEISKGSAGQGRPKTPSAF